MQRPASRARTGLPPASAARGSDAEEEAPIYRGRREGSDSPSAKKYFPQQKLINELNDVSVISRYPDDVEELRVSLTPLEVDAYLRRARELLKWLRQDDRLKQ